MGLLKDAKDLLAMGFDAFGGDMLKEAFVDPYVEKKVAERLKPDLNRIPPERRYWKGLKIGMSEKEVGRLLGVPDYIGDEYDTDFRKKGVRWEYRPPLILGGQSGSVLFVHGKLIYFHCVTKKGSVIEGYLYVTIYGRGVFHRSDGPCVKDNPYKNFIGLITRPIDVNGGLKPCSKCKP